jgi:hypothetical protein
MTAARSVKRRLRHDSELAWRYLFNAGPSISFRLRRHGLDPVQQRIVDELERDGVSISTFAEVFGDDALLDELCSTSEEAAADGRHAAHEKDFLSYVLGDTPPLDTESVFGRVALNPRLRAIANGYFGMFTQLRFYNVWLTRPDRELHSGSKLWHRDREDFRILKVFVYLRDVGTGAGPFCYAQGTHRRGPTPPNELEGHIERSSDAQLETVVPRDRWLEAIGPRGTMVFADTRGLHCGGRAVDDERLLFTCMYTSRDSQVREWFDRSSTTNASPELAFAVGAGRKGPAWSR